VRETPIRWILDASIGVKLVVPGDDAEKALDLVRNAFRSGEPTSYVPDLFYAECSNVIWKHVRRMGLSPKMAEAQLSSLFSWPFRTIPSPPLSLKGFKTAVDLENTAFDATYVVLAEQLQATLVTADQKLLGKLAGTPIKVMNPLKLTTD